MAIDPRELMATLLWYAIPLTPLITLPLIWQLRTVQKPLRIILAIIPAALLSVMLYFISIDISFSPGLGSA